MPVLLSFSHYLVEVNGSRPRLGVWRCITVGSQLFWFPIHFTDTDDTVHARNTFFNSVFASQKIKKNPSGKTESTEEARVRGQGDGPP